MHMKTFALVFTLLTLPQFILAATPLKLAAEWAFESPSRPDNLLIKVVNPDGSEHMPGVIDVNASQGIGHPEMFRLTQEVDGKSTAVGIKEVIARGTNNPNNAPGRASFIELVLDEPPAGNYKLSMFPGAVVIAPEAGFSYEPPKEAIETTYTEQDQKYAHPLPENKFSLQHGENAGAFSFQGFYGKQDTSRLVTLRASLNADISLSSVLKGNYLDRLEAEIGLARFSMVSSQQTLGLTEGGMISYGLTTKTQADQHFDKIDQTIGASAWLWLNSPVWKTIYRNFGLGARPRFDVPPAIVLGYDHVFNLLNDTTTPSLDGNNRLVARFYWSLPIGRNLDFGKVPLIGLIKQINLVTDCSGIYDLNTSKFAPQLQASLDFTLSNSDKHPVFSLSYVNGKSAPKFQNFDAFLAGFKLKF